MRTKQDRIYEVRTGYHRPHAQARSVLSPAQQKLRGSGCDLMALAVAGTIMLALWAPPARAVTVATFAAQMNGGTADFGSGLHALGSPTGSGTVTYNYSFPAGTLVATATVAGTLYWDSLNAGCARLIVQFQGNSHNVLFETNFTKCGLGGDANNPNNQAQVGVSFSSPDLNFVVLRTAEVLVGGSLVGGTSAFAAAPVVSQFAVNINNGTTDLGSGLHVAGGPSGNGLVEIDRSNRVMGADVVGTLYWDALFGGGTAQLIIDWQTITGTTLHSQPITVNGTGGDANNPANHKAFTSDFFQSASLFQVRLRVGQLLANGSFVNVKTLTFPFAGSVGSFELTPAETTVAAKDRLNYAFTWTVPEPLNWHDLQFLRLRISDSATPIFSLLFDEAAKTFRVFDEAAGNYGPAFAPGSPNRLETPEATLYLQEASVVASGPSSPTVTLNLPLSFKPPTAGRTFDIDVAASDDLGNEEDFIQAGKLTVAPGK